MYTTNNITIKLTYFRKTGKYYCDGSFQVSVNNTIHGIWNQVLNMRNSGELPGLVHGAGREFNILIQCPEHPHDHPYFLMSTTESFKVSSYKSPDRFTEIEERLNVMERRLDLMDEYLQEQNEH